MQTAAINTVTCSTCSENLEPWQRPLLTDRLGLRRDAYMARVKGAYVDRDYMHPADVTAVLAERHADQMEELQDRCMGAKPQRRRDRPYPLAQRVEDMPSPRGDAWRWGDASRAFGAAGGGGTQRVGPGWSTGAAFGDTRTDAAGIEVLIDGRRCIEIDGAWRDTTTGDLCTAQER